MPVDTFTDLKLASVHLLCPTVSTVTAGMNILHREAPGAGGWDGWLPFPLSHVAGSVERSFVEELN